ncbi:hypothetical protein FBU30_001447, partial [Linnemannia zychae]
MSSLRKPGTEELVTAPKDLCEVGRAFYQRLYTPDPIDHNALNTLLSHLPDNAVLSEADQTSLTRPIDPPELLEA